MAVEFEALELPFDEPAGARPSCPARHPLAPFERCPLCDGRLEPEHAHHRCAACGWRDSCCD